MLKLTPSLVAKIQKLSPQAYVALRNRVRRALTRLAKQRNEAGLAEAEQAEIIEFVEEVVDEIVTDN